LGPGPSRPGLGFWGVGRPGPTLAVAALTLPLAAALGCLGGGVRVHPSPLYKGGPRGGGEHTSSMSPGRRPPPPWPPPTSTLLSLPRGLLKVCTGGRSHHRCTLSCCGSSGSLLKGICPRGNNKVVIILFRVHNRCLFFMLELY
jgi:hypothetical protein